MLKNYDFKPTKRIPKWLDLKNLKKLFPKDFHAKPKTVVQTKIATVLSAKCWKSSAVFSTKNEMHITYINLCVHNNIILSTRLVKYISYIGDSNVTYKQVFREHRYCREIA